MRRLDIVKASGRPAQTCRSQPPSLVSSSRSSVCWLHSRYHHQLLAICRSPATRLFGLFQVSILHNIVHLLIGITGLAMARTAAQARTHLVFGGATIGSVLQDSGQTYSLDSLLQSGISRVVAGDGESMQDHDRNRAVDKGGDSRGVFASK
jgi:hypothetical protein